MHVEKEYPEKLPRTVHRGSTPFILMEDVEAESDARTVARHLVSAALAVGAMNVSGWSKEESALAKWLQPVRLHRTIIRGLRDAIADGLDPLGAAFARLRSPEERRPLGATYTPPAIVDAMMHWAETEGKPSRVIDPGAGSGRFAVAAARRFPRAKILAVEIDPLGAIMARGHLAAAGVAARSQVLVADFRTFQPGRIGGRTLYIGNPPYVRHHQIEPEWKDWLVRAARGRGFAASQLAGLHVHFFVATLVNASPGDYGAYVTSAEWLDVNYGAVVREMMLDGFGGQAIHVLEPTVRPFGDAATTAAITCFRLGDQPRSVRLRRVKSVADLGKLDQGQLIRRERLAEARRWTPLTRAARRVPDGYVELGELCRVHRGAVTGLNSVWVVDPSWAALPERALAPSVTRARELFDAQTTLAGTSHLRRVVDLPPDLDEFEGEERRLVDRFLRTAKRQGAASGYIACHRRAWWSVGLRAPAPILATYMARRPPAFVRNLGEARHLNIAHGLYPREPLAAEVLDRLAGYLRGSVTLDLGRTYAGGLTKFEPKEMERVLIPNLGQLTA